jgi:hypothetical protein
MERVFPKTGLGKTDEEKGEYVESKYAIQKNDKIVADGKGRLNLTRVKMTSKRVILRLLGPQKARTIRRYAQSAT